MSAVQLEPRLAEASSPTNTEEAAATLEEAAQNLISDLNRLRGCAHFEVTATGGYCLLGTRFGPAATIIASRNGEHAISARDLDLLTDILGLPAAASWHLSRHRGAQGQWCEIAHATFTLAN